MATLFEKIKKALGFYPKASYYKVEQTTGEPIRVEYTPAPEQPVVSAPETPQPEVEEPTVDNKDDGIDLTKMTRSQLIELAAARGITIKSNTKKQAIIDAINAVENV